MKISPKRPRQPPVRFLPAAEPGLTEILADPIVRMLMARDGVDVGDIRYLARLLGGRCRCGDARSEADTPPPAAN